MASGPGSVWQTATAWRISSLVSHLRSETSSRSICPTRATGPPKPSAPRRRKYRTSSLRCFFGFTSVSDIVPPPLLLQCGDAVGWRSVNPADGSAAAATFEGGSLKPTHGSSLDASSGEQSLDGKAVLGAPGVCMPRLPNTRPRFAARQGRLQIELAAWACGTPAVDDENDR